MTTYLERTEAINIANTALSSDYEDKLTCWCEREIGEEEEYYEIEEHIYCEKCIGEYLKEFKKYA